MENTKEELRKKIKAILKEESLNKEKCSFASKNALANLINFDLYKKALGVFLFLSYGTEINTWPLLEQALKDKKQVFIPKTEKDNMIFYQISGDKPLENQLEKGDFGISVPKSTCTKFNENDILNKTLIIVPGLGFDKCGNRLGKGKGFYDKFLEKIYKSKTCENLLSIVGYCYECQIVDKIYTEPRDVPVNFVITEKGILKIKE